MRIIKKIPITRMLSQYIVKNAVLKNKFRKRVNCLYKDFNYDEMGVFHSLFSKIFKAGVQQKIESSWSIIFANTKIKLPLNGKSLWLDWDTALSICGHDIEIKKFYEKLILSDFRPTVFFDIGANYGTHSILFLANDIKTVTFEPNPVCYDEFDRMAKMNNIKYHLEKLAIVNEISKATLQFPEQDTWLGSLSKEIQEGLKGFENVKSVEVNIITLDEYVETNKIKPDIIKIDTEGFELNVIMGAKKVLSENDVIMIFECNDNKLKSELFDKLQAINYNIYNLMSLSKNNLNKDAFVLCNNNNYLAVKTSHPLLEIIDTFA